MSAGAYGSEPRYQAYPTCDIFVVGTPKRDNSCQQGDEWGAVFVLKERVTRRYHICVSRPDGSHNCYKQRSGGYSQPTVDGFFHQPVSQSPGLYRFTWRMHGRVLDRDPMRLSSSELAR